MWLRAQDFSDKARTRNQNRPHHTTSCQKETRTRKTGEGGSPTTAQTLQPYPLALHAFHLHRKKPGLCGCLGSRLGRRLGRGLGDFGLFWLLDLCIFVHLCACFACVYIYIYRQGMHMHIHTHTHTRKKYTYVYVRIRVRVRIHVHIYLHKNIFMHGNRDEGCVPRSVRSFGRPVGRAGGALDR